MSGCPAYGELVGGYVLGALEPDEMEAMRRHLEECPACGPEARRMTGLPVLLDAVEPADVPPPTLSPAVEEAVLDRYARERRRSVRRRRRRPRLLAVGAAAAAAALTLVLVLTLGDNGDDQQTSSYATASLKPLDPGSLAEATAYVDAVPEGTRVKLWARGLKGPDAGGYALWCVRVDGSWVSGGTFRAGPDGRAEAELTAAVEPGDYHVVVVTRGSARGGVPGRPVLRGKLRY